MEFIQLCFALPNLPFTILLILVFLYWIMVIVGAIAPDAIGGEIDADAGGHFDGGHFDGAHIDGHVETGDAGAHLPEGSALAHVLHFFNVGEVPLMVIISFFSFCLWAASILSTHYLGDTFGPFAALILLVPNVIASLFLAKFLTMPFKPIFRHMNSGLAAPTKIVGKTCIIKTPEASRYAGQAEMATGASPILLNVRTKEGETLTKGEEALIVEHDGARDIYTVVKYDLEI